MQSQRDIWEILQDIRLGSDKEKWEVHLDAQPQYKKEHQLCLVVKGLNLDHQNPGGIKRVFQGNWAPKGCVDSKINEDGTIYFYFASEHQLLSILDNAPYEYRGWMVAVDRWINRRSPQFLSTIPFWITINKLPEEFRRDHFLRSIGSKLGHVDEVRITEPVLHLKRPAEAQVRVTMSVDAKISTVRQVQLLKNAAPVELEFSYKKLQKLCAICGSLRHGYERCSKASSLTATAEALMDIGHDPFVTERERRAAVEGHNSGQDLGESSGTSQQLPLMLVPISQYLMDQGLGPQSSNSENIVASSAEADLIEAEQGTKRKKSDSEIEVEEQEVETPAHKKFCNIDV